MKIESEVLWQMRPEYLNEDMDNEVDSAFNKGWNKCIDEFHKTIQTLERAADLTEKYAKYKDFSNPGIAMAADMVKSSIEKHMPNASVEMSEDGSVLAVDIDSE